MNLPNALSILRLCMVPLFVIVFFCGGDNAYIYAALVYVLAELTDCLDGYIARKFNKITRLGRILDPLADKLMAFTVLICIVIASRVPAWAAALFFLKEALMGLGAIVMFKKIDDVMPANIAGKVANVVFFANCVILMLDSSISQQTATVMISVALVVIYFAFFNYLVRFIAVAKSHDKLKWYRNDRKRGPAPQSKTAGPEQAPESGGNPPETKEQE